MILAYTKSKSANHPLEAELKVLHEGLTICHKEGIQSVIVEGDSTTI